MFQWRLFFIRQKPYDIVRNPQINLNQFLFLLLILPLSIDNDFILYGKEELFQFGLDIVSKLTEGITHLNIDEYTESV